jgi:hypothetical protein
VVGVLEEEGVQKFATSWHELLTTIETEMAAVRSPISAGDPAAAAPAGPAAVSAESGAAAGETT